MTTLCLALVNSVSIGLAQIAIPVSPQSPPNIVPVPVQAPTLPPSATPPAPNQTDYESGKRLFDRKQYGDAIEHFTKALQPTIGQLDGSTRADCCRLLGLAYQRNNQPGEAEPYLISALASLQPESFREKMQRLELLTSLGSVYLDLSSYEKALEYLTSANIQSESIKDSGSVEKSNILIKLGSAYEGTGKFQDAEACFTEALTLRQKFQGERSLNVADALESIGDFYQHQARYAPSLKAYQEALSIRQEKLPAKDCSIGVIHNDLGYLALSRNDHTSAEAHLLEALEIYKVNAAAPFADASRGITLENLADLRVAQTRYIEAEQLYRDAQDLLQKHYGANSPKLVSLLLRLGNVCASQRRYSQAEAVFNQVEAICDKHFGTESIKHANLYWARARLNTAQNQLERSENCLIRALAVYSKFGDEEKGSVAGVCDDLACVLLKQGRNNQARAYSERAVALADSLNEKAALSRFLHTQTQIYQASKNWQAAEATCRRMLQLTVSDKNAQFSIKKTLSQILISQSKSLEAATFLQECLRWAEENHNERAGAGVMSDLAKLYLGEKRYTEARNWQLKCLSVFEKLGAVTSIDYSDNLFQLAEVQLESGNSNAARLSAEQALQIVQRKEINPFYICSAAAKLGSIYRRLNDTEKQRGLEQVLKDSIALADASTSLDPTDRAACYNILGDFYDYFAFLYEAQCSYETALRLYEQADGEHSGQVANCLVRLAGAKMASGQEPSAELYLLKALKIYESHPGWESLIARTCIQLGELNSRRGAKTEAKKYLERALSILKTSSPNDSELSRCLCALASVEEPSHALQLYNDAIRLAEGVQTSSLYSAGPLQQRSQILSKMGRHQESEADATQAISIIKLRLGTGNPDLVGPLMQMGASLNAQRKYGKAAAFFYDAKAISGSTPTADRFMSAWAAEENSIPKITVVSKDDNIRLETLRKLRCNLTEDNRKAHCERVQQVEDVCKSTSDVGTPIQSEAYSDLAGLVCSIGGYSLNVRDRVYTPISKIATAVLSESPTGSELRSQYFTSDSDALQFCTSALIRSGCLLAYAQDVSRAIESFDTARRCLDKSSIDPIKKADTYRRLSRYLTWLGAYAQAQIALRSALEQPGQVEDFESASLQADLLWCQSQFDEAYRANIKALDLCQKLEDRDSHKLFLAYTSAAKCAASMGKLQECLKYASECKSLSGLTSEETAVCYCLMAQALSGLDKHTEALDALNSASKLYDPKKAKNYRPYASACAARGYEELKLGQDKNALESFSWALHADRNSYAAEDLIALSRDLNGVALTQWKLGNKDIARMQAISGASTIDRYLQVAFPQLSFVQACAFLDIVHQQCDTLLTVGCDAGLEDSYAYLMKWKGLLLEKLRRQSIAERLGKGTGNSSSKSESAVDYALAIQDPLTDISVRKFRALLKDGEAWMDVISYQPLGASEPHYGAVLVKSGASGEPVFFDIGSKQGVADAISEWRTAITGKREEDLPDDKAPSQASGPSSTSADKIRNSGPVWSPVAEAPDLPALTRKVSDLILTNPGIQEALGPSSKRLWLSAEGDIARIPWATIALLEQLDLQVCEADSAREFVLLRGQPVRNFGKSNMLLAAVSQFTNLSDLSGTLTEINQLRPVVRNKFQANQVQVLNDSASSKALPTRTAIVAGLSGARFAHIATHGFSETVSAKDRPYSVPLIAIRGSEDLNRVIDQKNPLKNCGLVLSPESKLEDNRDGNNILTADDIARIDLRGCDQVSLSACQTGLGRNMNGQGVIGLRSAIMAAGARCVLMSLWNVSDDATAELMTRFYSYVLDSEHPMSKVEALRRAQLDVRDYSDNHPGKHPEWKNTAYWGAWVLAGDGWETVRLK